MDPFSCCWTPRPREAAEGEEDGRHCRLLCGGARSQAPLTGPLSSELKHAGPSLGLPAEPIRETPVDEAVEQDGHLDLKLASSSSLGSLAERLWSTMQFLALCALAATLGSPVLVQGEGAGPLSGALAAAGVALGVYALTQLPELTLRGGAADEHRRAADAVARQQAAAEASEIRDANWRSLGLRDAEVTKVRELQIAMRDACGAGGKKTGVDFVTASSFLRARHWDAQRAEEMLRCALERRAAWQEVYPEASGSLSSTSPPFCAAPLLRHWRGLGLAGRDHDGDPVLWEQPGLLDWQGLSAASEDLIISCEILCMEALMQQLDQCTVQERRPVHRVTVVVDLAFLPMSFARPANLKVLKRIVQLDSEVYPETLKRVLLVRPPQKFAAVWKVLLPYFDPGTRVKLRLVPPEETAAVLQQHVPREHIPRFLGGQSRLQRMAGAGRIPRRLLRKLAADDAAAAAAALPKPPRASATASKPPAAVAAEVSLAGKGSKNVLGLVDLPARLHSRSFAKKEAAFPRSSWTRGEGALPPAHSWGSLDDVSAFPPVRKSSSHARRPHQKPMLELLDVDAFQNKNEEEPVWQIHDHPALAPQHYRRQGDDRFLLVVNWMIGPYQLVVTSALPKEDSPEGLQDQQLWRRFLAQPPALRWRRLRVSATCFEGPYIVHELIRAKRPSHVGNFLPSYSEGEGHLEVDVHLTSSEMRRMRVVLQHSSHLLVIGLAYFVCGDGPGELPERLLFAHYCSLVEVRRLRQV
mmetsp:Transcript_50457/g.156446  ORF Transcript_50457/g.156446 Transcript_50457/m.156446 type:complete len:753 (-) Transcript_50457:37-2295(-)